MLAWETQIDRLSANDILVNTLACINVTRVDSACISIGTILGIIGCTAGRVAMHFMAQVCRQRQEVCAFACFEIANVFCALVVVGAIEVQRTAIGLGCKMASVDVEITIRQSTHTTMLTTLDVSVTTVGNATNLWLSVDTNRLVADVAARHVGKVKRCVLATSDRVASVFGTRITIVANNRNVNLHVVVGSCGQAAVLGACILIIEIKRFKDARSCQSIAAVERARIRIVATLIMMFTNASFIVAYITCACISVTAKHYLFVNAFTRARIAAIVGAKIVVVTTLGKRDAKRRMSTWSFEAARLFTLVRRNALDAMVETLTRRHLTHISGAI